MQGRRFLHTGSWRKILLVLLIVCLISFAICEQNRVKRKVVFRKNSKLFFRLNGKANVIPWVQIFAQGWAIRVNWELPDTLHRRHRFFKRDAHVGMETITNTPYFRGYSCVLNYICTQLEMVASSEKSGLLYGIGKIISLSSGIEANFFKSFVNSCDIYKYSCLDVTQTNEINK